MSEETRSAEETGTPVAVSLGLAGASREEADAFLRDQRHHMHEQLKEISLRLWELRLGVLLRIATAFVGVAVAAALAFMIWNAARSNDLVIDAFAVPPELAAHGLSGPVVAAKLSDRIAAMQAETASQRPAKSYANGLSEGLKLEIPETGVSLSELDRFLRAQLGHDRHIGGEMVRTDQGVALTARVGSDGSATVAGAGGDTDSLLQKLAEQVYRITQPYRYAVWLQSHGRTAEATAIFKTTAASGPASERAWAYNGWANMSLQFENTSTSRALFLKARTLDPNFYFPLANIAQLDDRLGRVRESQRDDGLVLALAEAHGRDYAEPRIVSIAEHNARGTMLAQQGALLEAAEQNRQAIAEGAPGRNPALAENLAALHEPGPARTALAQAPIPLSYALPASAVASTLHARLAIALESQNWQGALPVGQAWSSLLARYPGFASVRPTYFDPMVARVLAHMGQLTAAEARLKPMPTDCYPCLIARAQVAELERQPARADWWFARAMAAAPALPFAYADWGRALLDRGKPDDAIVQFTLSNQKGPHFADPLEGWGEALMAKNQSHLALAKFAESENYAPNWGRLHLKWGEALAYSGKRVEAKAQFARAAALDLTPSEKSELARANHV